MNEWPWLEEVEKRFKAITGPDTANKAHMEFLIKGPSDINLLIGAVKVMKEALEFYATTGHWRSNIDMRGDVIEEFRTYSSKHLFGCDRAHEALLKIEKYATKKA